MEKQTSDLEVCLKTVCLKTSCSLSKYSNTLILLNSTAATTGTLSFVVVWIFPWEPAAKESRRILFELEACVRFIGFLLHLNRLRLSKSHRSAGPPSAVKRALTTSLSFSTLLELLSFFGIILWIIHSPRI